jgi:hypothetical protein
MRAALTGAPLITGIWMLSGIAADGLTSRGAPLLAYGCPGGPYDLGTRSTFGDLARPWRLPGVELRELVGELRPGDGFRARLKTCGRSS